MIWSTYLDEKAVRKSCDLLIECNFASVKTKAISFGQPKHANWKINPETIKVLRKSKTTNIGDLEDQLATEGFWSQPSDFIAPKKGSKITIALVRDDFSRRLMPQTCSPFSITAEGSVPLHVSVVREEDYGPVQGGLPMYVQSAPLGPRSQQLINAMGSWRRARLAMDTSGRICDPFICYHYRAEWANIGPFSIRYPELLTLADTDTFVGGRRPAPHAEGWDYRIRFNTAANWNHRNEDPRQDEFDLESVALHELGHGLGLAHSSKPANVMYPTLENGKIKRTLTTNDIDRARGHY